MNGGKILNKNKISKTLKFVTQMLGKFKYGSNTFDMQHHMLQQSTVHLNQLRIET